MTRAARRRSRGGRTDRSADEYRKEIVDRGARYRLD